MTVTDMGHVVEVQHMEKRNRTNHIRKINADQYIKVDTGELFDFEKSDNRSDNENSLRQTFKRMRYLINNNFHGKNNELFVTLTYAENMTDTKRLYKDFKYFVDRLRYAYKDLTTIDYLNVIEPQARGAWHAHVLVRFNDVEEIYVPNEELRELWGQGFVRVNSLKNVDNIGAYLSAYLTDLELTGENLLRAVREKREVVIRHVDGQEKKFVKGGRLNMYPVGMNLYRSSRGIKKPERVDMPYKDIRKVVGSAEPHYRKKFEIESDDFQNTISYEQYNLKRS